WDFYCSWADQGPIFYYFYLLKQTGGTIDADDTDHEMIHYIGVHKPWVKTESYATPENQHWVQNWKEAIGLWHHVARSAGIMPADLSGGLGVSAGFKEFQTNVNRLRKPGLLAGL